MIMISSYFPSFQLLFCLYTGNHIIGNRMFHWHDLLTVFLLQLFKYWLIGLLIQPLVGAYSDRCKFKLGRRRPFIIGMKILNFFVYWFLLILFLEISIKLNNEGQTYLKNFWFNFSFSLYSWESTSTPFCNFNRLHQGNCRVILGESVWRRNVTTSKYDENSLVITLFSFSSTV